MTRYDLKQYDNRSHKIREGSEKREYSSVHRAMKRLVKSGLIVPTGHKTGKKGAETTLYDLTVSGLARTIPYLSTAEIRQASQKHRDLLPEIFDLWSSFSQEAEPLAVERLKGACSSNSSEDIVTLFLHPRSVNRRDEEGWKRVTRDNEPLKKATVRFIWQQMKKIVLDYKDDLRRLGEPELQLEVVSPEQEEAIKKLEEKFDRMEEALTRLEQAATRPPLLAYAKGKQAEVTPRKTIPRERTNA